MIDIDNHDVLKSVYSKDFFTQDQQAEIFQKHEKITLKKGQYLIKEKQVSSYYYIIQEGIVRSFVVDYEGNEITTDLQCQGDIAIDVVSLFKRIPSDINLQAVTDTDLWRIGYEDFQMLFLQTPGFSEWGRNWMTDELFRNKTKMVEMITLPASVRYNKLATTKPEVARDAPLKYIASYLGIANTSLSRLRRSKIKTS